MTRPVEIGYLERKGRVLYVVTLVIAVPCLVIGGLLLLGGNASGVGFLLYGGLMYGIGRLGRWMLAGR
jgi:hypothetical protein